MTGLLDAVPDAPGWQRRHDLALEQDAALLKYRRFGTRGLAPRVSVGMRTPEIRAVAAATALKLDLWR
jgi:hypothetical protein